MGDTLNDLSRRGYSYKFLSQCYYLPDEQLMRAVTDAASRNPFFAEMARHIPPVVDLEALKVDFTRLFVGPFKVLAPPYGSAYLEGNRVMGESTLDAKHFYESEGLEVVLRDAPDHIAMELEFMYYLIAKEIEATKVKNQENLQSYRQKQCSFLEIHLARWLPSFAENVAQNTQMEFYANLSHLTDVFIQNDKLGLQKGINS